MVGKTCKITRILHIFYLVSFWYIYIYIFWISWGACERQLCVKQDLLRNGGEPRKPDRSNYFLYEILSKGYLALANRIFFEWSYLHYGLKRVNYRKVLDLRYLFFTVLKKKELSSQWSCCLLQFIIFQLPGTIIYYFDYKWWYSIFGENWKDDVNFRRKFSGRKESNFGENWTKQQGTILVFVEKSMWKSLKKSFFFAKVNVLSVENGPIFGK